MFFLINSKITLFSYANLKLREGFLKEALYIYDYLNRKYGFFSCYRYNYNYTYKKIFKYDNVDIHFNNANDFQKVLRLLDEVKSLKDLNLIQSILGDNSSWKDPQRWLTLANSAKKEKDWLYFFNCYLHENGLGKIELKDRKKHEEMMDLFFRIHTVKRKKLKKLPLVTVCMTFFNSDKFARHSIRSLIDCDYENLEIILLDDCSSDGTSRILSEFSKKDSRVKVLISDKNVGTYTLRNKAFQLAKGEFFTILDSDDLLLPERIENQVRYLLENSNKIGVFSDWLRVTNNGEIRLSHGLGGSYQQGATATLMIKTKKVRDEIGFWDSVRFAADTEFLFRIKKVYGNNSIYHLKKPLSISLFHNESLTNNVKTGINVGEMKGLSPVRQQYRNSWRKWHESTEDLYISFPLKSRAFFAPVEMIP